MPACCLAAEQAGVDIAEPKAEGLKEGGLAFIGKGYILPGALVLLCTV